jgi:hypothetical protein
MAKFHDFKDGFHLPPIFFAKTRYSKVHFNDKKEPSFVKPNIAI